MILPVLNDRFSNPNSIYFDDVFHFLFQKKSNFIKMFMCDKCKQTFSSDQSLYSHKRSCSNGNRIDGSSIDTNLSRQNNSTWFSWLLKTLGRDGLELAF